LEVNAGFAKKKNIKIGDPVSFKNIRPSFEIFPAGTLGKTEWNKFVKKNHGVVGAFLGTWEWGDFQKKIGLKIDRHVVKENDELVAVFMLVTYKLPFGLRYGYTPRGPIIACERAVEESKHFEILEAINYWARKKLKDYIFLRMEPPIFSLSPDTGMYGFRRPSYSIQPPKNTVVPLSGTEDEILSRFHSSTRSNVRRAERRGVTFEMKKEFSQADHFHFFEMIKSTSSRHKSTNAYPTQKYLRTFMSNHHISTKGDKYNPEIFSLGIFCGYQNGAPAATHIVVFFGDTATYLFGASYTKHLNSKVDTYLHFAAMKEAKNLGMKYYDLGGIDEKIWPSLTTFKRQCGGEEIVYVGNIDIPIRRSLYHGYNTLKKTMKKFRGQL